MTRSARKTKEDEDMTRKQTINRIAHLEAELQKETKNAKRRVFLMATINTYRKQIGLAEKYMRRTED